MLDKLDHYSDTITQMAIEYTPKLALAIITLFLGLIVIGFITRFLVKQLDKSGADPSLTPFVRGILSITLKLVLLVSVAGMVGIKTTSFVAVIGAAGLAIGLALQGSLSNFAGSILILFFKPYKIGDVIEVQGETGTVSEIQIFNTKMITFDNKVIFIPNGKIANNNIKNLSFNSTRRVDFIFGIGYSDDIDFARDTIKEVIGNHSDKLVADKDIFVKVTKLNDSSVDFAVKIWCNQEDYWDLYHAITEDVKKAFDAKGISIPFPQRDVHLFQESK